MPDTAERFPRTLWRDGRPESGTRVLAEEAPVAISYNGSTQAVLMATPADLEDLAYGFSLTEGIVDGASAIESVDVVSYPLGLDVQIRVRDDIANRLARRRRSMAGPVGCGMCGLESLEAASRHLPRIDTSTTFASGALADAARGLEQHQHLNHATGAAHAAGFLLASDQTVLIVREDVGRHNALDKLIGAMLRAGIDPAAGGFIVTSRISVELVEKTAMAGAGLIAAISAPTALAVRAAEAANITLAAVVRGDSFEVFACAERIASDITAQRFENHVA